MKLWRLLVAAIVVAAGGAFVAELLRPRPRALQGVSYHPPAPAPDRYVVLPKDR